ncbi:MAG: hypothetical protein LC105_05970 [Chitinophagales bacterium]|nr:hypothetical protein [Chitinophagales bacterium]
MKDNNISFIVNLTTAYNMQNYEQWFLPFIQEKKLLGFDLSARSFSVQDEKEEYYQDARKKIEDCRNLWHLLLKSQTLQSGDFLKIILVIDADFIDEDNCNKSYKKIVETFTVLLKEIFVENERNRIYLQFVFLFNLEHNSYKEKYEQLKSNKKIDIDYTKSSIVKELIFNYTYSVQFDNNYNEEFVKLSLFLAESIDWFGLGNTNSEQRLFTHDDEKNIFNVISLELNDSKKSEYASKMQSINIGLKDFEDKYKNKRYRYTLKISSDSKVNETISIDENQKDKFFTIDNLHKRIPFFYSKKKNEYTLTSQNNQIWQDIEETIEKNRYEIQATPIGINRQTFDEKIEDIKEKHKNLSEKVSHEKLQFQLDKSAFLREKIIYDNEFKRLAELYGDKCRNLAVFQHVILFGALFSIFLYLFLLPIYRFQFPITSLLPWGSIILVISALGFLGILYMRSQIKKVLKEISALNYDLYKKFENYVSKVRYPPPNHTS